jgi:hypothetical protein
LLESSRGRHKGLDSGDVEALMGLVEAVIFVIRGA